MYKQGLVLGKFLPFTLGHKYLIDSSLKQSDFLTVLVCTLESEPIPGYLRYDWIRETYNNEIKSNKIKIVHVFDELPQESKDEFDLRFWNIWTSLILRECPTIDAIFTSETYGDNIADYMLKIHSKTIKHICVDLNRDIVPISGTRIRNNAFINWEFVPKTVRPYLIKKICIVGAESAGKSVMSDKLGEYFGCSVVHEYGREYCEKNGAVTVTTKDISIIAQQQLLNEDDAALNSTKGLMICDTNLMITELFSNMYNGSCPTWIKEYNRTQHYDLYLLLNNDVPFVNDGIRQFEDMRDKHFHMIREELYKRNDNYIIIDGDDYDERLSDAIEIIKNIL